MSGTQTTLDQWQALRAVVERGSFSGAAEQLELNESAIRFALHKLEQKLNVQVLQQNGQKIALTEIGQVLYERSRQLLTDAHKLETMAGDLTRGRETTIRLSVDAGFSTGVLLEAMRRFAALDLGTRIHLNETVGDGVAQALINKEADLGIGPTIPPDAKGERLMAIEFIAVAHPQHVLHEGQRKLLPRDLQRHVQIVAAGSSGQLQNVEGWVSSERRWTVAMLNTALSLIRAGLGFGWLPRHVVKTAIENGELKPLNLQAGGVYHESLFLIVGDMMNCGPATARLVSLLQEVCAELSH